MLLRWAVTVLCLICCLPHASSSRALHADDLLDKYKAAALEKWASELKRIEALDARETDPPNAILFLGSSSIRLWEDIAADLNPWPVVARGYGGAKFSDLVVLCEQLIRPHKFRAVAIFVGNDVTGGKDDKTAAEVVEMFEHVVATIRRQAPDAPIFLIEITPTPKRWDAWDKIKQVNAELRAACQSSKNLHFVATADRYLDANGQPMPELFKQDKLHQNRDGYQRWSELIRKSLTDVLKSP